MNLSEQISELVTMPEVLRMYGYDTGRSRRIPCPLHGGKDSNFCYTDSVFHCWTCGAKGNVIGFAMQLFNLNFGQALIRLNNDFRLGLTNENPTVKSRALAKERIEKRQQERALREYGRKKYLVIAGTHARLIRLGGDVSLINWLEDWLDENIEMVVVK